MRLLVVGGGGREHAFAAALRRDNPAALLYFAPGNPGTAPLGINLPVAAVDLQGISSAAAEHAIDLAVIGPEQPLAMGLADLLRADRHAVMGPSAAAARLESSKAFAKEVMETAGVQTARSVTFADVAAALAHVDAHPEPLVVKASGLAAGKGAIVCATREEARAAVRAMLAEDAFGEAGRLVVIEEFLRGEELSVFAITNGLDMTLLPPAQDHKRLYERDEGPNTGGMGAYSPVRLATPALLDRVRREVLEPTLEEMQKRRAPFRGILYAGLMVDPEGAVTVVEFNCRLGDPEAQAVLPLVRGGLTEALRAAALGDPIPPLDLSPEAAVTTVVAAAGYPDQPRAGDAIQVPEAPPEGVSYFHAGTSRDAAGVLRTAGGRVMACTAIAATFSNAQRLSRSAAEAVRFEGKQFRRDIGWREEERARDAAPRGVKAGDA